MKKLYAILFITILCMTFLACGGGNQQSQGVVSGFRSPDPDYANIDLTRHVNITIYNFSDVVVPDRADVVGLANERYFMPILNTTVEAVLMPNTNAAQMYPLLLAGGSDVDVIFTAPWRYYNEEASKGSFVEITDDLLRTYLPKTLRTNPPVSWVQARMDGRVYGIPPSWVWWEQKMVAIREDLRLSNNLPEIRTWQDLENYVITVGRNDRVYYNTSANTWELMNVYLQYRNVLLTVQPVYFAWEHRGGEPGPDDLHFLYTSSWYRDYALTMARWYTAGAFDRNVMNQTIGDRSNFPQGRSSMVVGNFVIFMQGNDLIANGQGIPSYWDISQSVDAIVRRMTYDNNLLAIAATSNNVERSALVIDLIKNTRDLNEMIRFGIEGRHWIRTGPSSYVPGPETTGYPAGNWISGPIFFEGQVTLELPADTTQQEIDIRDSVDARLTDLEIDGFRLNVSSMQSEWAVMSALIEEYRRSFECGIFEGQTAARFDDFSNRLRAAGLDRMVALVREQYAEFRRTMR